MAKFISKRFLSEKVFQLEIEAPLIARKRRAGNFATVRTGINGERIPLTIVKADSVHGTVVFIIQVVGSSTYKLSLLQAGDEIKDIAGPLGNATRIGLFGTVLCAGGGVGIAPLFPIVEAMHNAGNRVVSVLNVSVNCSLQA